MDRPGRGSLVDKPWLGMARRMGGLRLALESPVEAGVPAIYRKATGDLLKRCRRDLQQRLKELERQWQEEDSWEIIAIFEEKQDVEAALEFLDGPWPQRKRNC